MDKLVEAFLDHPIQDDSKSKNYQIINKSDEIDILFRQIKVSVNNYNFITWY